MLHGGARGETEKASLLKFFPGRQSKNTKITLSFFKYFHRLLQRLASPKHSTLFYLFCFWVQHKAIPTHNACLF